MKRKAKIKGKLLFFALVSSLLLCGSSYTYRKDHSKIEPRRQTGLKGDPILDDTTIQSYYSSVNLEATNTSLLNALHTLNSSKRRKMVGYSNMGTYYPQTDGDPNNSKNLIAFYSGTSATFSGNFSGNINREHVWPNSRGGGNVEGDIHMPRPTLKAENGSRGNSFYVEGKNSSTAGWDPAMETFGLEKYRGISARIIFYCAIADTSLTLIDKTTDSSSNKTMGKLSDLLKWNLEYEIDSTETQRNDAAQSIQGNRNPFIDDRSLPCKIWGDTNATTQAVCASYTEEATPTSLTLKAGSTSIGEGGTTELEVSALPLGSSNSVKFTSSNESVATVSSKGVVKAISAGDTVITATSTLDETVKATITIHVKKVNSISVSGTPNKTTYVEGDTFDLSGLTITALYDDGTSEVVNPNDCYTLDGVTGLQTLSIGTTSVYIWYGTNYVLYEGIEVTEAPKVESYRIEFQSNSADGSSVLPTSSIANQVTSGSEYIESFANVSNVYSGKKGLKLSSSKNDGSFTMNLSSLGKVKAKTLKLGLAAYKADETATITINNQTITCSSSTSVTEHEVSLDGSELDSLTISSSGRCYLSYIEVGSEATETPTISFTSLSKEGTLAKTIYKNGESFDVTGLTIYANYSDNTKKDVTKQVKWSSLTLGSTSIIGSYTEDSITKTIEIGGLSVIDDSGGGTFEITPLPTEKGEEVWKLVEDDTTLKAGDQLVLAENTKMKVASTTLSSNVITPLNATFSNDKKTMNSVDNMLKLTLGGKSGAWTLSNSNDELLGATAVKKVAFGKGTTTWKISINSNANATIQNTTSAYGRFLYNVNNPRFTTYTSSTSDSMLLIQLYRFEASTATTYTEVGQLMKDIQDANFCDDYSLANGFLTRYQNLSDEDKTFFESAIISTDGTTYLERLNFFASKAKQNQLTSYNFINDKHQNLYMIFFIVGLGMISIIVYAYILKKKSYQ